MGKLQQRAASRLPGLAERVRATRDGRDTKTLRGQVSALRRRVAELEEEVIENRQLARRIAELTDVVEELLLPEDVRDPSRLEERLGQIRRRH